MNNGADQGYFSKRQLGEVKKKNNNPVSTFDMA